MHRQLKISEINPTAGLAKLTLFYPLGLKRVRKLPKKQVLMDRTLSEDHSICRTAEISSDILT